MKGRRLLTGTLWLFAIGFRFCGLVSIPDLAAASGTPPPPAAPAVVLALTGVDATGRLQTAAGEQLCLSGLWQPPVLPRPIQEALTRLVAERRWQWKATPIPFRDRYHCLWGDLSAADIDSLAEAVLAQGLAAVHTLAPPARLSRWLALEQAARQAGQGLWADPRHAPRRPEETRPLIGSFQIVQGTVQAVARIRQQLYLNFGPDWRQDFTIRLSARRTLPFTPAHLVGREVRARGWLVFANGPLLSLDNPEFLELLPP